MTAKNNICDCADSGARERMQLEVECLKGYGTIKSLGTTVQSTQKHDTLGLNICTTVNFHKAVNNLRDKARRDCYAIKRTIKFDIPIRIWLTILESVIEPFLDVRSGVRSPTKNSHNPYLFYCPFWTLMLQHCTVYRHNMTFEMSLIL